MSRKRYPVGHMRGPDLIAYGKAVKDIERGCKHLFRASDLCRNARDMRAANLFESAAHRILKIIGHL